MKRFLYHINKIISNKDYILLWPYTKITLLQKFGIKNISYLGKRVYSYTNYRILHFFEDFYIKKIYDMPLHTNCPIIIDAGANTGMATLYFEYKYPKSKIIAFEPDKDAYNLLTKNVSNAKTYQLGLWDENKKLNFFTLPEIAAARNTVVSHGYKNEKITTSINVVKLSDYINCEIDLLKIDVEGSETKILLDLENNKKIKLVKNMVIEYDGELGNDNAPLDKFLNILKRNSFKYSIMSKEGFPLTEEKKGRNIIVYAYK